MRGVHGKYLCDLHEKHGNVVRTGPKELSFRTASAAKTIYGGKPGPANTFHKLFIAPLGTEGGEGSGTILSAKGEEHARQRKLIAPAFKDSTLRAQEPMIQQYCSQMIQGLRNRSGTAHYPNQDGVVDMNPWTNFIVSDILSHILFGSGLGCLKNAQYNPWLGSSYKVLVGGTFLDVSHRLWPYHKICEYIFTPTWTRDGNSIFSAISQQELEERSKADEPYKFDLPSIVSESLTEQELFDNLSSITVAAGHTTSSTLSNILYYLTHNLEAYKKLVTEVRGAFEREEDINAVSSGSLPYLKATIRETFRIHPTIPVGLPRITPEKGKFIDGNWVPGGVGSAWTSDHDTVGVS